MTDTAKNPDSENVKGVVWSIAANLKRDIRKNILNDFYSQILSWVIFHLLLWLVFSGIL